MERKVLHMEKKRMSWIDLLLDRSERPLIIILHVGILFRILSFEWASLMVTLPTVLLATIFFLAVSLNLPGRTNSRWAQLLFKSSHLGCSIAISGLFFKTIDFPIYKWALLFGTLFLLVVYLLVLWDQRINPNTKIYRRRDYIRNLAIIIIGSIYYFTPI